jgi:hypothetical protein
MCGPSQLDATHPRGVEHRGCGKLPRSAMPADKHNGDRDRIGLD